MKTNETVNEAVNEVVNNEIATNEVVNNYNTVIKNLLNDGCKRLKNLKIKNVNILDKTTVNGNDIKQVVLTLTTPVKGFITEDNITWKEGMTNVIFTSLWAIVGAFKEDDELGWMANAVNKNPNILNLVLNGANIDVVQQFISAGEAFTNPFTTRNDAKEQSYDHDIIINHVVKFTLSKMGNKMADKLADKMLDFE